MRSRIVRLASNRCVSQTVRQRVECILHAIAQARVNVIVNALDVAKECATHARVAHTCCYVMRINKRSAVVIVIITVNRTKNKQQL